MSLVRKTLYPISILLLIESCGTENAKTANTDAKDNLKDVLIATMSGDCAEGGTIGDDVFYSKGSLELSDENKFTYINESYEPGDSKCVNLDNTWTVTGTFEYGEALENPTGAKAMDYLPTAAFFTLADNLDVAGYNGDKEYEGTIITDSVVVCGGGWEAGKKKEITKGLCADEHGVGIIAEAYLAKRYNIYKIEDGKYYPGKAGEEGTATDGSTTSKRPVEYEKEGTAIPAS
jgi:hypothetical protein